MSTWTRGEVTTTKMTYTIPLYEGRASWAQIQQALSAAQADHFRLTGERPLADDAIWYTAEDDAIVIWFEKPGHQVHCAGCYDHDDDDGHRRP